MFAKTRWSLRRLMCITALGCLVVTGCHAVPTINGAANIHPLPPIGSGMPHELSKVVLPPYVIEPPDILFIEAVNAVPKSPYRLKTLDVLSIQVAGTLPDAPISGAFPIEPGGIVNLGIPYGGVRVAGLTADEARTAIEMHLRNFLREPQVAVALVELGGMQQVGGEYLVGPDGTVTLGSYGSVSVVGKTLEQAKLAIEQHISRFLENPVISLSVSAFNSKVYYIVLQGGGLGDVVYRFPVTGNETVLDAIAQVNGLDQVSSKKMWVSRPTNVPGQAQTLPVNWQAITESGATGSNYQILPGDRVFIAQNEMVAFDNGLAKLLAPFERAMGFSILGAETVTRYSGPVLRGGGNPRGFR